MNTGCPIAAYRVRCLAFAEVDGHVWEAPPEGASRIDQKVRYFGIDQSICCMGQRRGEAWALGTLSASSSPVRPGLALVSRLKVSACVTLDAPALRSPKPTLRALVEAYPHDWERICQRWRDGVPDMQEPSVDMHEMHRNHRPRA